MVRKCEKTVKVTQECEQIIGVKNLTSYGWPISKVKYFKNLRRLKNSLIHYGT